MIVGDAEVFGGGLLWRKQGGVAFILPDAVFKGVAADNLIAPRIGAGVDAHVLFPDVSHRAGQFLPAVIQHRVVARLIGRITVQIGRLPQDRFMGKSVLLPLVHGAEDRGDFSPLSAPLAVVFVVDIDLEPRGGGKKIRRIAGGQLHRFGSPGIGIGKTLGHAGVALVFAEVPRDIFLVPLFQQAGCQGFAQIGVRAFQVRRQKFRDGAVPGILPQQVLKVFPALGAENGVGKRRVAELDVRTADVGDFKGLIVQIYRVAYLVGRGSILGNCPLSILLLLAGKRQDHIMECDAVLNGVAGAGNRLTAQIGLGLFFLRVKPILPDELGNTTLHLRPR
ncbi:hypothetical protein SDC9_81890 [bioreactor metagenome]|uniref:Uncharacterized protein n=1 Tax=bioreactor metagenome TaxID=1076179 RepID=A0A644Z347_9ZZZZ